MFSTVTLALQIDINFLGLRNEIDYFASMQGWKNQGSGKTPFHTCVEFVINHSRQPVPDRILTSKAIKRIDSFDPPKKPQRSASSIIQKLAFPQPNAEQEYKNLMLAFRNFDIPSTARFPSI